MDVGDLDVVAEDLVEADLQGRDAGAARLTGLELGDPALPLAADAAQVVQLDAVARLDQVALGQHGRRVRLDGGGYQALHLGAGVQRVAEDRQQRRVDAGQQRLERRQVRERAAQADQVPRVRPAGVDLGGQPLDVVDGLQLGRQVAAQGAVADQLLDGVQARRDGVPLAQGHQHPAAQQAGAHGCGGAVEHVQQAALLAGAPHGLGQLQAAARGGVQHQVALAVERLHFADVAQGGALGLLQVADEGAGGGQRGAHALQAEAVQAPHAEQVEQAAAPLVAGELPGRPPGHHAALRQMGQGGVLGVALRLGQQALGGRDALEAFRQGVGGGLLDLEAAGRDIHPGQAGAPLGKGDRRQEVVGPAVEYLLLGQGAGGHDAGDVALDEALRLGGVLHLVADGHAVAGADEALDVAVGGVVGEAGHRDGVRALVAAGERQAEHARAELRVLEERLVEVAHAEEQDGLLVPLLEGQVLLHHGRLGWLGHRSCGCWIWAGPAPSSAYGQGVGLSICRGEGGAVQSRYQK